MLPAGSVVDASCPALVYVYFVASNSPVGVAAVVLTQLGGLAPRVA